MATRIAHVLYCVTWGVTVKTILIVAISAMLLGVLALLITEIVGKRNLTVGVMTVQAQESPSTAVPEAVVAVGAAKAEDPDPDEPEQADGEVALADEAVLVDDGDNAETGTVIVGETRLKVRYNRSFTARLVQAEDPLKGYYSALKNELLRYGLKLRMSWNNESWYRGRTTYAKFAIRGKTLSLYLALDPAEFQNTKYGFKDVGKVSKYHDVPMRLKIKSNRAVRWAKELIAVLAEKAKWKRKELAEENFRPDYRDTTSLVRDAYIKLYYVGDADVSKQVLQEVAAADLKQLDRTPREFTTKLMRADSTLKAHYSAVKNELLRYGMKPRMSTGNESWYRGRRTYAKFAIRGKTLVLFMALNPEEFVGTKYNFSNMSNVNKYGTVPMRVKLKSDRSVRWVKELIATMAEKKGWTREALEEQDFRYVDTK